MKNGCQRCGGLRSGEIGEVSLGQRMWLGASGSQALTFTVKCRLRSVCWLNNLGRLSDITLSFWQRSSLAVADNVAVGFVWHLVS